MLFKIFMHNKFGFDIYVAFRYPQKQFIVLMFQRTWHNKNQFYALVRCCFFKKHVYMYLSNFKYYEKTPQFLSGNLYFCVFSVQKHENNCLKNISLRLFTYRSTSDHAKILNTELSDNKTPKNLMNNGHVNC